MSTEITAEVRAEWRRDARWMVMRGELPERVTGRRILALLDALEEAEQEWFLEKHEASLVRSARGEAMAEVEYWRTRDESAPRTATVRYRSPAGRWLTVTGEVVQCICAQTTSRLVECPVHHAAALATPAATDPGQEAGAMSGVARCGADFDHNWHAFRGDDGKRHVCDGHTRLAPPAQSHPVETEPEEGQQ